MARLFDDASSQYLTRSGAAVTAPPFTMACWFYSDDALIEQVLLSLSDTATNTQFFRLGLRGDTAGDHAEIQTRSGGTADFVETSTGYSVNTWHHACGVWTSSASRAVYLDGGGAGTSSASVTPSGLDNTNIGATVRLNTNQFMSGRVAEAAIWDVALDAAEVAALAKGFSPLLIRPQSLVAYWPLVGNDSPELDRWKNGYDLTLTNAPTKADHPRIYYPSYDALVGLSPITTVSASPVAIGVVVPTAYAIPAIASPVAVGVGLPAATVQVIANASPVAVAVALPAARLWGSFDVTVTINSTQRQSNVMPLQGAPWSTLTTSEALNDEPDTATMRVKGFTPREGHPVEIWYGFTQLFGGSVVRRTQINVGSRDNVEWDLYCMDWTRLLNRRLVNATYTSETVYDILLDLLANNSSGFTTTNVDQTALDAITLDEIVFTDEPLASAISRLMKRAGGYWYADATRDIHAFLEDTANPPDSVTDASDPEIEHLVIATDISQIRTRVFVEGIGTVIKTDATAGLTSIPVEDSGPFASTGGLFKAGTQRCTYTGKNDGGGGALIGALLNPTNGPTVAARIGTGIDTGDHYYAVTFYDGTGETTPGPNSSTYTSGTTVTAPASAPTATKQLGGNLSAGAYKWKVTYVDSAGGETDAGSSESASVTMDEVAAPTTIGTASNAPAGSGALDSNASYSYKYTFYNGSVETSPSPASNSASTDASQVMWLTRSGVQAAPSGYERRFYRTEGNGSTYKLMPGASDGFSNDDVDKYIDEQADAVLGASAPSSSTAVYRQANLAGIPVSPDANVVSRKLYRTEANGSTFKLVTTIANNTATTYTDNTADASLGATLPVTNTAVYKQASLANIPLGPTGTSGRKLYRTAAGGSQLKLLATIADNTTATYTDSTADASLGANVPTSNTSGLTSDTGTVNAGATSILVTGLGPFSASGGWVLAAGQCISYTGKSSTSLTGVPASGAGAITSTLNYGTEILSVPSLSGIPASGTGAIQYAIAVGDQVNVVAQVDDATAQATLAALEGGDGIHEHAIQDRRLTLDTAEARGTAELNRFKNAIVTVSYETRDPLTHVGKTITFNLGDPTNLADDFVIQRVTRTQFTGLPFSYPRCAVEASNVKFSLEDLLRRALLEQSS